MSYSQLYFPSNIPQWGIFLGIAGTIIGYVEKKAFWNYAGWITLIITGLISLYFNLFGGLVAGENIPETALISLRSTGWQSVTGGALAAVSLYFMRSGRKSYKYLSVLTLIYFMLVFFSFNYISRSQKMVKKTLPQTEKER